MSDEKTRYGMSTAADLTSDDKPADWPDNDRIFADLMQLVENGLEASAKGASLTISYANGCSLTWKYEQSN